MADNKTGTGLGLTNVLGLIFITLKLTDNINWSWWWVLSPFWIQGGIVISIIVIWSGIAILRVVADKRRERQQLDDAYRRL